MKILFAPLQGYTHFPYRNAHRQIFGGVDEYYTPFLRFEQGSIRNKDRRDVEQVNNALTPTVPQVIAANVEEFQPLCDFLQQQGWGRVDLNMGCPFPMQVHSRRGCALLPNPDRVAPLIEVMRRRPEVRFSLKMRLGLDSSDEALRLLPLLNEAPIVQITLHPRLGTQQYKGSPDNDAFAQFYEQCRIPLVYNGDLLSAEDISSTLARFPRLQGVMLGRGLLTRPWLAQEWRTATAESDGQHLSQLLQMHDQMLCYAEQHLQGESQMLSFLRSFWDYPGSLLPKKTLKRLMKCGNLKNYLDALSTLPRPPAL